MQRGRVRIVISLVGWLILNGAAAVFADEGMWTFDRLPTRPLEERYGFTPTPEWAAHLQHASVRFGGASGSFVSPDGLVLTNHHVAFDQLQKLSTPEHDYVRDGFYARTRAEEIPCPDQELRVLISTEDVTSRVVGAIDLDTTEAKQSARRRAVIAAIEEESTNATGLKSEVVELYRGGQYWVYRYKTYTDVRLVMAPESRIANFGGDLDNFTYPRHDLDICFFRIYENGEPFHSADYLPWSRTGPKEGELVFVAGHPGSTSRLRTAAQLEFENDHTIPVRIQRQAQRLKAYHTYSARGTEEARRAEDRIAGLENSQKRLFGFQKVLSDPKLLNAKRAQEDEVRVRVAADQQWKAEAGGAWDRIAKARDSMHAHDREVQYRDLSRVSRLVDFANAIVRYTAEVEKPDGERLSEFRGPKLESQRFRLFSRAPVFPDMDEYILGVTLQEMLDELGPEDVFVKTALGGKAPGVVAHDLITDTRLTDVALRKSLIDGGRAAVAASQDPLIQWALKLDAPYRELRTWVEVNVEGVESNEGGRIAKVLFDIYGDSLYPDATGTLRLSYGKVAGYASGTTLVPWKTTLYSLYGRSANFDGRDPFDLPPSWIAHRKDLDLSTPINFVTTDDIIGGNSGSPVINRAGECVGVVFDGNIEAFRWDFAYDDIQARCVAVHSTGILEALRKVYGMQALADELEAGAER